MTVKDKAIELIDDFVMELNKLSDEIDSVGSLTIDRKLILKDHLQTSLMALDDARFTLLSDDNNSYFLLPYSVAIHLVGTVCGELHGAKNKSKLMSDYANLKKAKYQPLKELAAKLVKEKNFKSRRNAAITISPEIVAESKKLGISLSEQQAEITITNWLKEMGLPANV